MPKYTTYYVPEKSYWPLVGSIALFISAVGAANLIHQNLWGAWLIGGGLLLLGIMMVGWFSAVIQESSAGLYSPQLDRSFRWGMVWFIFSEIMFFAALFGILLYARLFSVPWLGGLGHKLATHTLLWPHFQAQWPLLLNPDPTQFVGPHATMSLALPAFNTIILLCSSLTLAYAHRALQRESAETMQSHKRIPLMCGIVFTILLGMSFLSLQLYEYHHAYTHLGLTLKSGIYGSTFFLLTGFHGLHVAIGTLMLSTIALRCYKGHFSAAQHFGFEATVWYWHFVDGVWLFVFILVYCL